MLGTYALSSGYYDAYYGRAQKVRTKIAEDFNAAWETCDFMVSPTSPGVAFELGAKTDDPWAMYLNDYCTVPIAQGAAPAATAAAEPPDEPPGTRVRSHGLSTGP